jgi:pyridoxal phosphate enzyme (YggS family)
VNATGRIEGSPTADIPVRLSKVRQRIALAAELAGRDPGDVRLVVVTKDVDARRAAEALAAGARDLGENRAQELAAKIEALASERPQPHWHFIGTLQRNKVKAVVGVAALIHSVDSVSLGRAVAARAGALGIVQDVLLEVNVSGEATKHGLRPAATAEALGALAGEPGLTVRGLMTIAPAGAPSVARRAFADLRDLRQDLRGTLGGSDLEELSMGMTSDFEEAVEEGATIVRVGTAIFGPRRTPAGRTVPDEGGGDR